MLSRLNVVFIMLTPEKNSPKSSFSIIAKITIFFFFFKLTRPKNKKSEITPLVFARTLLTEASDLNLLIDLFLFESRGLDLLCCL